MCLRVINLALITLLLFVTYSGHAMEDENPPESNSDVHLDSDADDVVWTTMTTEKVNLEVVLISIQINLT